MTTAADFRLDHYVPGFYSLEELHPVTGRIVEVQLFTHAEIMHETEKLERDGLSIEWHPRAAEFASRAWAF